MNNVDPTVSKRTLRTRSPSSSVKRPKTEHYDTKLDCYTPPPLPLSATQGVERIPLPPFVNVNLLSSQYLEQRANERTEILRRQGRHVVGLPMVLNDGIVLNWVHPRSGSVDGVRSYKIDDTHFVVHQGATRSVEHGDEKLRLSVVSTCGGSGTSAADAIIIESDEDVREVSSLPRINTSKELPINHDASSNQDVISYSDSDIELLEGKVEDDRGASYHSPLPLARELSPAGVSDMDILSDSPPNRALSREEDAVALRGLPSDGTDIVTSESEVDEADKVANGAEGVDDSRISAQHAKPLSLPSLQPIKTLLARRQRRGDPEPDVLPEAVLVTPGVSQKHGRRDLEQVRAITSSESDEEADCQASDPQLKRVPLPKTDHGRARRLLMPKSADLPLVAVTMRGDCHFIERKKKFRITGYSLPNPGVYRHVEDVCMVGDTAVLGCDKGRHQISFLSVAGKPQMIDVARCPHSSGPRYQDTQKLRGVSRLAAIHAEGGHIKFLSGGYDGTIHWWTADVETLKEPRSRKIASYGACVMALAYRDRDRSVVASTQKRLHITDLNRCKTMTHPFSNKIQQIHIHPQAAYVTLLEVRHLDRQVQLYDSRKGGFDSEPCLSFGHRNTNGEFSRGHTRGSAHLVHFAKASEDGDVLLWDFRNSKRAVVERRFEQAQEKVVHTIFADTDIATYGQGVVTFFENYLLDDVRGT